MKLAGKLIIGVCAAVFSCGAYADETIRLGRTGMDQAFVWRDAEAQLQAYSLIRAQRLDMLVPLIACMPSKGTAAVAVKSIGWASQQIVVVEGPSAGCVGVVADEDVH